MVGTGYLMLHNGQTANPLNPYAQAMKFITAKRKKTDADYAMMSRIEWEAGLYLKDGEVVIPADNLDACLFEAAKKSKNGKLYQSGILIAEDFFPLEYDGPKIKSKNGNGKIPNPDFDKPYSVMADYKLVKVGTSRVVRCRPIFKGWALKCSLLYNEDIIDVRTVEDIIRTSEMGGFCERRPRMGRFTVEMN